jgi:hypothetical protein
LVIVLSVLLRSTASDYYFGIFSANPIHFLKFNIWP